MPDATPEPGPEPQGPEAAGTTRPEAQARKRRVQKRKARKHSRRSICRRPRTAPVTRGSPGCRAARWTVRNCRVRCRPRRCPAASRRLRSRAWIGRPCWRRWLPAACLMAIRQDQDAELAEELEAERDGRMGPSMDPAQLAALAVEYMEPGPALAGWLNVAAGGAASLNENGLTGLAIAARKQAAHVHGVELTAVAQITSRAAAADQRVGVSAEGRPARVCRDAVGQVEMALRLSHDGAEAWADLALTLTWRLPRTGAALAVGWIDLDRAQIIARATSVFERRGSAGG